MEKQQKKQVKKYISWVLLVAVVALLACMPLLAKNEEAADGPQASILTATAAKTDISAVLMGGGALTAEKPVEITIPAAVKLTGYQVGNGDVVKKGDVIATVDRVTVMTAITQVQETLDHLAEEIETIQSDSASETVTAQAGGTVKILYAREGQRVQDVMLEHGALAVLSLDGLMAVQVERNTGLSGGDTVCVTLSDGTSVDGRVESNLEGILTVTVADEGYAVGEVVTITTEDGDRIGSGALYIHSRWNAVAYSGTVSDIRVSEGDAVTAGRTLIHLKDTGHTAQYYRLSDQHREYEELMLTMFRMYQSETLTAPCDGVVTGVDETGAYMLSDDGTGWQITLLANAPNGDDETGYVNYIGQVTAVGLDGLVLKMNPQPLSITDYKDLSAVPTDPALMTQDVIHAVQVPVYELAAGEWVQVDAATIVPGDVLLFAGDAAGNFVWVVRVAKGTDLPEEPDPSQPSEPEELSEPVDPSVPSNPGQTGGYPQIDISGFAGGMMPQEEEFSLYSLETVTIASVTAQEKMTVEISIDELDITKIYLGQRAAVTVDALNGERFTATVTQIGNSGESDGGNSKFTVELTLDKNGDMLPGMSASVVITLGTQTDCLSVPVAALTEIGAETVLYTSYDEETGALGNPVAVTVGMSDGENAQILSGIDEGTVCYYAYYDILVISDVPDMGGFPFG